MALIKAFEALKISCLVKFTPEGNEIEDFDKYFELEYSLPLSMYC